MTRWICILAAVTGFGVCAFGQAGKAELFGTVRDPAGLPVVKARVQAEEQATRTASRTVTDERGEYHFLGLAPGDYVVTVEQRGFRTYRRSGIALRTAGQTALDVTLDVGDQAQSVEVNAAAPLLQTASGDVSFSVDQRQIGALPLDGRNFIPLVALAPGVALPSGGSLLPRIGGSRPRTNEYIYDGVSVLQPEPGQVAFYPVLDAIAEFRLNINAYSPEYGRSNGGTVIVSGKSGGNDLHGTLFEYFRHEALNARNYFAPSGAKPAFRRNQFGFVVGGPIQKNRTFFFVDWQGSRLRTGVTRFSSVPTAAQRQGIFATPIYDPLSSPRAPFANNAVPMDRFDSIARQVLARYPEANLPGAANNFRRTAIEPDDQDQVDVRLDRYFGSRHRIFGRYSRFRDDDRAVTPLPDGSGALNAGALGNAHTRGDGVVVEHTWNLSPTLLHQTRIGFTRRDLTQRSLDSGAIRIPGIPVNAFSSVLPVFSVTGFQQIGPAANANSDFTTSVTEFLNTLSLVRGRHTFKLGSDIRHEALSNLTPPNPAGAFSFTTTGTNLPGVSNSGNALASLLLGQVNAFSIDILNQSSEQRANIAEFFVGDDWKVSDRLALSIGTRYTLNFPSTIQGDRGAVFNLKTEVLDFQHTARELECCAFGPRAGLAYRVGERWVIRSGYGMMWFEQSGITTPFTIPLFPFIQTAGQQSQDNLNAAFNLANGPTVDIIPPNRNSGIGQGVFSADRFQRSGVSQQWNLTLQHTIGRNWNVEVGYLGSKNTRLGIPDANLNQLPASDLALGSSLLEKVPNPFYGEIPASSSLGSVSITRQQLLRAFPRFTTVALYRDNVGNSTYNALHAKLEKRFSNGLSLSFAYTFSKLIDDASSVFSPSIFIGPVANGGGADAFNRHLEKDLSQGDIPRVFSGGWVYELPRFWKFSGLRIGGLVRVQSGGTIAVAQGTNSNASLGYYVQRPNRVRDPNSYNGRDSSHWFDTFAFSIAPQFTIGDSSRNPVRGPGLQIADLMVSKTFRTSERTRLEFRAEAFNVANTPAFADPNGSFGTPAFGTITNAANPRVFEFAAKLLF
ncbi:MAG: TonB-dependent receptor [Bryobacteraceae bacterium]